MTYRSDSGIVFVASLIQRSWAFLTSAEKVNALQTAVQPSNLVQPHILRLDGGNPHGYWLRPTSQPFFVNPSHVHARTRAYTRACVSFFCIHLIETTTKQVGQVGRLDEPFVYAGFSRPTFRPTLGRLDG